MALYNGQRLNDIELCVNEVIRRVGKHITLGLPLGLGKPIRFVNALYERARNDPQLKLHIVTALSLLAPVGSSSLEKRFLAPFTKRLYGDIPELAYARDAATGRLPDNVQVSEFFFKAGDYLNNPDQQRHYVASNYTHVVRDLMDWGVNVVAQMVSPGELHGAPGQVSLSCNPDLSLDLLPLLRQQEAAGRPVAIVAETNRQLPWLGRDAAIAEDEFDVVFDDSESDYSLFSVPQMAVEPADHLIGFYASTLLKDGGTLQVGIGSLGTAVVHSTLLRHQDNSAWQATFDKLEVAERFPVALEEGGVGPFQQGLYGCSEMMVDGFMQLMKAGILRREVYSDPHLQTLINQGKITARVSLATLDVLHREGLIDSPMQAGDVDWLKRHGILRPDMEYRDGQLRAGGRMLETDLDNPGAREAVARHALGERLTGGVVMHGGFYLGPQQFYRALRELSAEERDRICMTSVNYINHLYDHPFGNQQLKAAQRVHGRFINTALMNTLSGAAVSDGLEDGRVISGVGGQYNFVSMAHELPTARSVITLRSTRETRGQVVSNIVFSYGHCTIPRHLRDIVITEYGIADLRAQPDEEVYLRLIRIADARFQKGLLRQAQKAGKVDAGFRLPASWRKNTPAALAETFTRAGDKALFPRFPFGRDFTDQELELTPALEKLQSETATRRGKLSALLQALRAKDQPGRYSELLERMGLSQPCGWRQKLDRRLMIHGLQRVETSSAKSPSDSINQGNS